MATADANPSVREIELGVEASFTDLPYPVEMTGRLLPGEGQDRSVPPALGHLPPRLGTDRPMGQLLHVPRPRWRFELSEGICVNGPRAQMYRFEVTARDGLLYAAIPDDKTTWE